MNFSTAWRGFPSSKEKLTRSKEILHGALIISFFAGNLNFVKRFLVAQSKSNTNIFSAPAGELIIYANVGGGSG